MTNNAACTIVSKNYFAYAKTLADSYTSAHPEATFYILIVDRKDTAFEKAHSNYNTIWVEDLGIDSFLHYAFKYDILELNTNVKPALLRQLLKKHEKALYIDPDIFIYKRLDDIYSTLDSCSIVLTPHITSPIQDKLKPTEVDMLKGGIFNLGFIGVRRSSEALSMLDWWHQRCMEMAFNEPQTGVFVDQKWANLIPCLFDKVHIEKSPGYNMAYWNLHERRLTHDGEAGYIVNESHPLHFFHFSGVNATDFRPLSKYQNRSNLDNRPDLEKLFTEYCSTLLKNGHAEYASIPYSFGKFRNGTSITPISRKIYAISPEHHGLQDPFLADSQFYKFAVKKRLIDTSSNSHNTSPTIAYTTFNTNHNDIRLRAIRSALHLTLLLFGAKRYELLLKYLNYIVQPRNQRKIFFKD
ncbi:MAG: group 1 glycosyl transferase [Pseudogulbenkiania sp.]|nr:group 1 glycosyl transferase [Pseudogulbenkiania sp.]